MRASRKLASYLAALLLGHLALTAAYAQRGRINIDRLNKYESTAVETVDVTLDGSMLQLAASFLSDKKPEEQKIKALIKSLRGLYVKAFEFDQSNAYSNSDLEDLRHQLTSDGWNKLVGVRSRRHGDNVDVYILMENDQIDGLAVIAADPTELTVVNIVGSIDIDKLREIEGQFGIPKLELIRSDATDME